MQVRVISSMTGWEESLHPRMHGERAQTGSIKVSIELKLITNEMLLFPN